MTHAAAAKVQRGMAVPGPSVCQMASSQLTLVVVPAEKNGKTLVSGLSTIQAQGQLPQVECWQPTRPGHHDSNRRTCQPKEVAYWLLPPAQ